MGSFLFIMSIVSKAYEENSKMQKSLFSISRPLCNFFATTRVAKGLEKQTTPSTAVPGIFDNYPRPRSLAHIKPHCFWVIAEIYFLGEA